jgi:hypothetical protein
LPEQRQKPKTPVTVVGDSHQQVWKGKTNEIHQTIWVGQTVGKYGGGPVSNCFVVYSFLSLSLPLRVIRVNRIFVFLSNF